MVNWFELALHEELRKALADAVPGLAEAIVKATRDMSSGSRSSRKQQVV